MDNTQENPKKETEKWLSKLEKERSSLKILKDSRELKIVLRNVNAYMKDCRHFMEKKDFVRAFEAVIYAWGLLEACEHLGLVKKESPDG